MKPYCQGICITTLIRRNRHISEIIRWG